MGKLEETSPPESGFVPTEQSDKLPAFEPLMLSGLTYAAAKQQARVTGCAICRPHWCNPVLIWEGDRLWMDDEGETTVWSREGANEDMRADDWMMVEREPAEGQDA